MVNDPNWKLPEVPGFELTSPDFEPGGALPQWARAGGAGGEDRSPELCWSGAPEGTKSFVLTIFDPDAPTSSGWWHWAVRDLPATLDCLPRNAGAPDAGLLPAGAVTHPNENGEARYGGAWPPPGHGPHRYFFTLSALGVDHLDVAATATPAILSFVVGEHIIARAQLVATSESPA